MHKYLQIVNIDATPDPPILSLKLYSRTSKGLSLGVLLAIVIPIIDANFSG